MRKIVLSRCVTTHACVPAKAISAGPSPTRMWATTLFVEGAIRSMLAP
jgi:hypothetical protein